MKRLGLGDLGAGRRKYKYLAISMPVRRLRPSGFQKRGWKLPWLRNAQLLRSQTELFAT